MSIKIYVDSGCGLTLDQIKNHELDLIEMTVNDENKEYRLEIDITESELYERMRQGTVFTSAAGLFKDYLEKFSKDVEEGHSIIYLGLSKGITSSNDAAQMAKNEILSKFTDAKIELIDTRCAVTCIGYTAIRLNMAKKLGYGFEDLVRLANTLSRQMEHIYSVDDMVYLYRGGRISKTKKIMAGMLNIKPVLSVDKDNGKLIAITKVRGEKKLFSEFLNQLTLLSSNHLILDQTVSVVHSDCLEKAEELKQFLETEAGFKDIQISTLGAVIGCHTGPGCLCLFFSKDTIEDERLRHIQL